MLPDGMIRKKINKFESDAKLIRKLSFALNTVLGNACYSDKEKSTMIKKGQELGNLDNKELELVNKVWDKRTEMAKTLLDEMVTFLTDNN